MYEIWLQSTTLMGNSESGRVQGKSVMSFLRGKRQLCILMHPDRHELHWRRLGLLPSPTLLCTGTTLSNNLNSLAGFSFIVPGKAPVGETPCLLLSVLLQRQQAVVKNIRDGTDRLALSMPWNTSRGSPGGAPILPENYLFSFWINFSPS